MKLFECIKSLSGFIAVLLLGAGCAVYQAPVSKDKVNDSPGKYFIIHQQQYSWWLEDPVVSEDTLKGVLNESLPSGHKRKWIHLYITSDMPINVDTMNSQVMIPLKHIISVEVNVPSKNANGGLAFGVFGFLPVLCWTILVIL